jgi:hypothetical protein
MLVGGGSNNAYIQRRFKDAFGDGSLSLVDSTIRVHVSRDGA